MKAIYTDPIQSIKSAEAFEKYVEETGLENITAHDWLTISSQPFILSEKLLTKYASYVKWDFISMQNNLPAKFIRKHENDLWWFIVAKNPIVPADLLEKHKNEIFEIPSDVKSSEPDVPVEKPKRHRRTKAEMEEARKMQASEQPKQKRHRRTKAEMEEARRASIILKNNN